MGHPHYERQVKDGALTHVADSGWEAPRLCKALLEADAGKDPLFHTALEKDLAASPPKAKRISLSDAATFDAELKRLLEHVHERLEKGVLEAWFSPQGYENAKPAQPASPAGSDQEALKKAFEELMDPGLFFLEPEEQWARAICETLVFAAYGGTGQNYFGGEHGDSTIAKLFPDAHPIIVACQHMATLCILSRGFPYDDVLINRKTNAPAGAGGCSCTSGTVDYVGFDKGESFDKGTKYTTPRALLTLQNNAGKPFPAGSVVVFNSGGPKETSQNKGTAHIASVLRVSGDRIQFFDTGVLGGSNQAGEGGTADHSFLAGDDAVAISSSLVAVGVLGEPKEDLVTCALKVSTSRALGYARLVVLDISDPSAPVPRFVSKMVHMKYPITRYVWSMRELPTENLRVLWYLYIPVAASKGTEVPDGKGGTKMSWTFVNDWIDPFLKSDATSKKPVDLMPGKQGKQGNLLQTHVIRGEPGGKAAGGSGGRAGVARRKLGISISGGVQVKQDGWSQDLAPGTPGSPPPPPTPEMAFAVPLGLPGSPKLEQWCRSQANVGHRFIQRPSEASGATDEVDTGVPFFDP